ncbi:MAG: glycine zipper 2TM domain-containing protein [Pseudomonadota bacterium]
MKKILFVFSMISLSGIVCAADMVDTAQVISSTPIYERVTEPRRECTTETVPVTPEHSVGGAVVGGVAGAAIGSQIGQGTGKKAATVAGGIAGAVIGDRVATRDEPRTQQIERCRELEIGREVITGYKVIYRYNGQDITTTLPYQPGSTIRVRVNVIEEPR